jgi:hypothetical protein
MLSDVVQELLLGLLDIPIDSDRGIVGGFAVLSLAVAAVAGWVLLNSSNALTHPWGAAAFGGSIAIGAGVS